MLMPVAVVKVMTVVMIEVIAVIRVKIAVAAALVRRRTAKI
jgi:hypothetical protein